MKTTLILLLVFFAGGVYAQTVAPPAVQDAQNLSPAESQASAVIPGDRAKQLGNTLSVDSWTQRADQYQLETFIVPMVNDPTNLLFNSPEVSPQKTAP